MSLGNTMDFPFVHCDWKQCRRTRSDQSGPASQSLSVADSLLQRCGEQVRIHDPWENSKHVAGTQLPGLYSKHLGLSICFDKSIIFSNVFRAPDNNLYSKIERQIQNPHKMSLVQKCLYYNRPRADNCNGNVRQQSSYNHKRDFWKKATDNCSQQKGCQCSAIKSCR